MSLELKALVEKTTKVLEEIQPYCRRDLKAELRSEMLEIIINLTVADGKISESELDVLTDNLGIILTREDIVDYVYGDIEPAEYFGEDVPTILEAVLEFEDLADFYKGERPSQVLLELFMCLAEEVCIADKDVDSNEMRTWNKYYRLFKQTMN